MTFRMDVCRPMQVDEFRAAVPMHCSGCGIGLDNTPGFSESKNDQSISYGFKDFPIWLIFFFRLR